MKNDVIMWKISIAYTQIPLLLMGIICVFILLAYMLNRFCRKKLKEREKILLRKVKKIIHQVNKTSEQRAIEKEMEMSLAFALEELSEIKKTQKEYQSENKT